MLNLVKLLNLIENERYRIENEMFTSENYDTILL